MKKEKKQGIDGAKQGPGGAKPRRLWLILILIAVLLVTAALLLIFLLPEEETPPEPKLELIELSGLASYSIVYPEEPGPVLLSAARGLFEDIKEKTGVRLSMSDDFVMPDWDNGGIKVVPTDTLEILVGVTNRAESTAKKLGRDDWGIYFQNNRVVISGGTEESVALAVAHFRANYIKDGKVYYPSQPVIERGDYPYGSATLMGKDIYDWVIVRDSDNKFLAELIRDEIAAATGAVLPIRLEKDAPVENEILVGIFSRNDERKTPATDATRWYIEPLDTRLSVRGGGLDGTYAAAMAFREYFAGEGNALTLTFPAAVTGTPDDLSLYKLNLPEKLGSMAEKYDLAYSTETVLARFLAAKAELPAEVTVLSPVSSSRYALSEERVLYVSPTGDDGAAGTKTAPLATLQAALDKMGSGGGVILLEDGVYSVTETIALAEKHSGARQAPLFIKAVEGASPSLTANKPLSTAEGKWHTVDANILGDDLYERIPEEARNFIFYTTLEEQGWTHEDVPKITKAAGPPSLFVGTSEYHLARFPNKESGDLLHFTRSYDTGTVTARDGSELYFEWENRAMTEWGTLEGADAIKHPVGWEIRVQNALDGNANPEFGEEITSWVNTGNIWFYGSTFAGWEFGYYNLALYTENTIWAHNTQGKPYDPIKDAGSHPYLGYPQYDGYYSLKSMQYNGWGCRDNVKNTYFLFNAIEALDAPGEWFYDEVTGRIFLYPNEDEMELSEFSVTCSNPREFAIMSIDSAHNVVLDGLTFNGTSGHGLSISRSGNIVVQNCTFANARRHNLTMSESMNTAVIFSDFSRSGSAMLNIVNSAATLALVPTNNVIQNNVFHDPQLSQHVALGWGGCRLVVSHNYFVNTTTTGTAGVECILEYNRFEGGSYDVEDGGMIYASGATSRGNHYRNNLFHMFNVTHQAVYNDTMGSGNYMYYNVVSTLHSRTESNKAWYSSTGWGNVCYGNVTILRNPTERLTPGKDPLTEQKNAPVSWAQNMRGDELNESDLFYYYFGDEYAAIDKRAYSLVDMNGNPQGKSHRVSGTDYVTLGAQETANQREAGHWWTGIKEGDVSRYLTKTSLKKWIDRAPEYINMMYGTRMIMELWNASAVSDNDDVDYHIKYFYLPWYLTGRTYTYNTVGKEIPAGTVVQIPEWQYLEKVTEGGEEKIKLVTVPERLITVEKDTSFTLKYEEVAAMERIRRASAYCVVTNNIIFGGKPGQTSIGGVTVSNDVVDRPYIITDNGSSNLGYKSTALKTNNFMSYLFADYAPGARAEFTYDLTSALWDAIEAETNPAYTLEPEAIDGIKAALDRWDAAGPTESINYDEWFSEVYPEW